ncbi:hypothetical protein FSP39_004359 [Pinctada imbricata]|uniref:BTB domain-containing protein n=1 Tax=Pinctada imbricata TaxID=66713 RepID=A0AA88XMI1_PINIB|nr:hypothetical protein FSP39_004359 [Pinctada imbricata]
MRKIVNITVGGKVFRTTQETLDNFPNTRLGKLTHTSDEYDAETDSFIFDRNPDMFNKILDLYRLGEFHISSNICGSTLRKEMEYWQIPTTHIGECCIQHYFKYDDDMKVMQKLRKNFDDLDYTDIECKSSRYKRWMRKVWLTVDQPLSSIYARIYNYIFMTIVVLSMVSFVLGSHPSFRKEILSYDKLLMIIEFLDIEFFDNLNLNNSKEVMFATTMASPVLSKIDLFCMIFFSVELVVHFISCPIKKKFFTFPLNVLDPVLLTAMWTTFAFENNLEFMIEREALTTLYQIMKALVVLRLFRFFRIVKIYSGLKIIMITLSSSVKVLLLLFIAFVVAGIFFASFIYYAEFQVPDNFPTIFTGIWWAIVTMTTVGYGDMYPQSTYGHLVGASCAFFGILILSMPIAIVSTNFFAFYQKNKEREQQDQFKKDNPRDDVVESENRI